MSEDSKRICEKDGADKKYSNWQEPSKKNDIGDDESDDEPPDEQPIIKCKRYVIEIDGTLPPILFFEIALIGGKT